MLAPHGLQYWGLGSWTNGCAAMHHPPDDAADGSTGAALHSEFSLPAAANETAAARFGPWPTAAPYPSEEDYHAGSRQVSCRRHNPYLSLRALRCERYGL